MTGDLNALFEAKDSFSPENKSRGTIEEEVIGGNENE